jgi:hypothetical protein
VQRLTVALATPRPWLRVTNPERARSYFEARARGMLTSVHDQLSLVEREEREAKPFALEEQQAER